MKYSLLCSNLEHFLKLFANLLDQSKDTQIKRIKMAATRFSTTLSDPQHPHHCLHFVWVFGSSQLDFMGEEGWETPRGPDKGTELLSQGMAGVLPGATHLSAPGNLALQTSSPKRFKGHPRSGRSWVVVWRLYSWTEGLNMVIVNLCPFVPLIPHLFPAPPLLGLGRHQISWLQWVIL